MDLKLFNRIHTSLYEEILKGKFKPSLPRFDNDDSLKILFTEAQTLKLTFNEEIYIMYMEEVPDMKEYGFKSPEHFTYTIMDGKKNGSWELTIIPLTQYKLRDNIQIPIYPTAKAKEFSHLICDEFERIKIRAEYVLEQIESREKLNLYAIKNITKAKKLHHDAGVLIANLQKEKNTESVFIIFVLDLFIIQTIKLYQKLFKSFIDSPLESEFELKTELYTLAFSGHAGFVTGEWGEKKSGSQQQRFPKDNAQNHSGTTHKKSTPLITSDSEVISDNQYNYAASCENTDIACENRQQYRTRKGRTFSVPESKSRKYKINGQINVICRVMEQLTGHKLKNGKPFVSMTQDEMMYFIADNFLDKENYDISLDTLETYLRPKRTDKKIHPLSPKMIDITDSLKEEESPAD